MMRTRIARLALAGLMAMLLLTQGLGAIAEADTRWADAADQIDKFLDTAFEDYPPIKTSPTPISGCTRPRASSGRP